MMSVTPRAAISLLAALALCTGCNRGDTESDPAPEAAGDDDAAAAAVAEPHDHGASDVDHDALLAAETEASQAALPIFATHCARCHMPGEPDATDDTLHHFSMEAYPFRGHHAHQMGDTIRAVLGADGGEPTMPDDDPGALSDEELEVVLAWAEAFDRAHAAGAGYHAEHRGSDHDHDGDHDHDHDH
jgi:mono/diheme cytochrome c family protein